MASYRSRPRSTASARSATASGAARLVDAVFAGGSPERRPASGGHAEYSRFEDACLRTTSTSRRLARETRVSDFPPPAPARRDRVRGLDEMPPLTPNGTFPSWRAMPGTGNCGGEGGDLYDPIIVQPLWETPHPGHVYYRSAGGHGAPDSPRRRPPNRGLSTVRPDADAPLGRPPIASIGNTRTNGWPPTRARSATLSSAIFSTAARSPCPATSPAPGRSG